MLFLVISTSCNRPMVLFSTIQSVTNPSCNVLKHVLYQGHFEMNFSSILLIRSVTQNINTTLIVLIYVLSLCPHLYANDLQLYLPVVTNSSDALKSIHSCLHAIKLWLSQNCLCVNESKTPLIFLVLLLLVLIFRFLIKAKKSKIWG